MYRRWTPGRSWIAWFKTMQILRSGDCTCDGTDASVNTLRNGSGAPSPTLGIDGDFYIDVVADTIYGPKTAGAWGSPVSLIGPVGPVGPAGPAGPAPTGTGFAHTTGGVLDAAARAVNLASTDVVPAGVAGQIQASNGASGVNAPGPYVGAGYISTIAGTPTFNGFRTANNTVFSGQNFEGTADIVACYIDSSDQVRVGSSFDTTQKGISFGIPSGGGFKYSFEFGSGEKFSISETATTALTKQTAVLALTSTDCIGDRAETSTTGTTSATLWTYSLPTNALVTFNFKVTASQQTTCAAADWWIGEAAFRNSAGTGADVTVANIVRKSTTGSTTWTVTFTRVGNVCTMTVTGSTGVNVTWGLDVSYQITRP